MFPMFFLYDEKTKIKFQGFFLHILFCKMIFEEIVFLSFPYF